MNDEIMYAWQVVGSWSDHVHFTCARLETAEYLRDWLQAIEEYECRYTCEVCGIKYVNSVYDEQQFSIQECEVIL